MKYISPKLYPLGFHGYYFSISFPTEMLASAYRDYLSLKNLRDFIYVQKDQRIYLVHISKKHHPDVSVSLSYYDDQEEVKLLHTLLYKIIQDVNNVTSGNTSIS